EVARHVDELAVELRLVSRLGLAVQVADGELAVDRMREHAAERDPKTEFGVEDIVKVFAERAELLEDVASPERRGLRRVPRAVNPLGTRSGRRNRAQYGLRAAVLVHVARRPGHPAGGRVLRDRGSDGRECTGQVVVVAVDVRDELSR